MRSIKERAIEFAKETTCTRCPYMGHCDGCEVKFCDYTSRYEAYIAGYEAAETDARTRALHDLPKSVFYDFEENEFNLMD